LVEAAEPANKRVGDLPGGTSFDSCFSERDAVNSQWRSLREWFKHPIPQVGCAAVLLMLALLAGCREEPPAPGGGEHKITHISILAKEHGTLAKDKNPTTLAVGGKMPLRVMASWAIPYVEDVTDKAKLSVSNPACGEVDAQGVFVAKTPGKVVIQAELRVAKAGYDRVLSPTESAGADPVVTLKDSMELTVVP